MLGSLFDSVTMDKYNFLKWLHVTNHIDKIWYDNNWLRPFKTLQLYANAEEHSYEDGTLDT